MDNLDLNLIEGKVFPCPKRNMSSDSLLNLILIKENYCQFETCAIAKLNPASRKSSNKELDAYKVKIEIYYFKIGRPHF
jgi:hypothetical protein